MTELVVALAGARFHKGAVTILARMPAGTLLQVVREDNRYDPLAVAVWLRAGLGCPARKLGYVPKKHNWEPAWALAGGRPVTAEFLGCDPEGEARIALRWP